MPNAFNKMAKRKDAWAMSDVVGGAKEKVYYGGGKSRHCGS